MEKTTTKPRPKVKRSINVTGQVFSRLTAIKLHHINQWRSAHWLFKCECGSEHVASLNMVKFGKTQSCGCLNKENFHRIKQIPSVRIKMGLNHKGKKCTFWKGGVTPANKLIRASVAYKNWRTAVFVRDEYTCQECGQVGGKLNADHIKPFAYFVELRFSLDNGRTLCVECHRKTDTYGIKAFNNFKGIIA